MVHGKFDNILEIPVDLICFQAVARLDAGVIMIIGLKLLSISINPASANCKLSSDDSVSQLGDV